MANDKLNLRDIEPLRKVEDLEVEGDRPSEATPAMGGTPPALGVPLDTDYEPGKPENDDLDQLRRG